MTPIARALAGCAALSATAGLILQTALTIRAELEGGGTVGSALWDLARFFTIWSNTAMAVVMGASALAPWSAPARPTVRLVMTAAIALVAVVYYTLLADRLHPFGTPQFVAENLLHAVGPVFCIAAFFAARDRLPARASLWAIVPPAVYGSYGMARGLLTGSYPYWFLDLPALGLATFARNAVLLFAGFVASALVLVMLGRAFGRFRPRA